MAILAVVDGRWAICDTFLATFLPLHVLEGCLAKSHQLLKPIETFSTEVRVFFNGFLVKKTDILGKMPEVVGTIPTGC